MNLDCQVESQRDNNENESEKSSASNPINSKNTVCAKNQSKGKKSKKKSDQSFDEGPSEIMTRAEVHRDSDVDIKDILKNLSDHMHTMQDMMNKRMDMIELKIEQSESKMTDRIQNGVFHTSKRRTTIKT